MSVQGTHKCDFISWYSVEAHLQSPLESTPLAQVSQTFVTGFKFPAEQVLQNPRLSISVQFEATQIDINDPGT